MEMTSCRSMDHTTLHMDSCLYTRGPANQLNIRRTYSVAAPPYEHLAGNQNYT